VKEPKTNSRDISNNVEVKLQKQEVDITVPSYYQLEKPYQEHPNSNNSYIEVKYEPSMNNMCSCGPKGIAK
jgi:hypothetical protein